MALQARSARSRDLPGWSASLRAAQRPPAGGRPWTCPGRIAHQGLALGCSPPTKTGGVRKEWPMPGKKALAALPAALILGLGITIAVSPLADHVPRSGTVAAVSPAFNR